MACRCQGGAFLPHMRSASPPHHASTGHVFAPCRPCRGRSPRGWSRACGHSSVTEMHPVMHPVACHCGGSRSGAAARDDPHAYPPYTSKQLPFKGLVNRPLLTSSSRPRRPWAPCRLQSKAAASRAHLLSGCPDGAGTESQPPRRAAPYCPEAAHMHAMRSAQPPSSGVHSTVPCTRQHPATQPLSRPQPLTKPCPTHQAAPSRACAAAPPLQTRRRAGRGAGLRGTRQGKDALLYSRPWGWLVSRESGGRICGTSWAAG